LIFAALFSANLFLLLPQPLTLSAIFYGGFLACRKEPQSAINDTAVPQNL
jgi:hypothetical protein